MWLPEWLYDRLPVLYVVCSGVCLLMLGISLPSTLSSALFLTAALLTHSRRRIAQKEQQSLAQRGVQRVRPGARTPARSAPQTR